MNFKTIRLYEGFRQLSLIFKKASILFVSVPRTCRKQ